MEDRRSWLVVIPVVVLLALLIPSANLEAQCSVTNTVNNMTGPTIYVIKYLNSSPQCALTNSTNVVNCFPGMLASTSVLLASARTTAINPSCVWTCNCGPGYTNQPFTINSSDGLPVELMHFSVEDESEKAPGSDNQPAD